MMKTVRMDSDSKDFRSLVKMLDEELYQTYGIIQKQYDRLNLIENLDTVVVGYIDGIPAGCGCFKKYDSDRIEIKRMFVKLEARGTGIAAMILSELEKWAKEKGYTSSVLETGIKQLAAMKFYEKLGYKKIQNYGAYIGNENSLCMGKQTI
jgi:putative acetyltransferase